MSLKDNLLKKIEIKKMAKKVVRSLLPGQDGYHKIDKETMRRLLEMTSYVHKKRRDLDLYVKKTNDGSDQILVLDNGLPIYMTDEKDVVLRKSPTVKEIINILNIFKILNDSDVVLSKKEETVDAVKAECIQSLDLSINDSELDQIIQEGEASLDNRYADGVLESMLLFSELLDYVPAPDALKIKHHIIYGKLERKTGGLSVFGPMVIFSLVNHELKFYNTRINPADRTQAMKIREVANGQISAETEGPDVFQFLKKDVLDSKRA